MNIQIDLTTLGGRIRAVRESRDMSVTGAARAIGVSRPTFWGWEKGTVKDPDGRKLLTFADLSEVSLAWLLERRGPDPQLTPRERAGRRPRGKSRSKQLPVPAQKNNNMPVKNDVLIPEITPALEHHAERISSAVGPAWMIPEDVLVRGFLANPSHVVIQHVTTGIHPGAALNIRRGDYLLIDTSRKSINEPGLYLLADPDRKRARRAIATAENGHLKLTILADDVSRPSSETTVDSVIALGRVMGVFHPV